MRDFELTNKYKSTPIVYLDLDGVLCDFFGEVARHHHVDYWREIHRQDIGIDQIAQETGFFKDLPPLPNAGKLVKGVLSMSGKYSILSSPLLSNVENSSEEKAEWLKEHLKNHQPQAIILDHEKYKFACMPDGTPNILIDDWDTNIRLWEGSGGIGILYKDSEYEKALYKLKRALNGKITVSPRKNVSIPKCKLPLGKLYTPQQVLSYINGIHHEYHLEKPVEASPVWILELYAVSKLKNPEYIHQDDPYRRVIDINWERVNEITPLDIMKKPIVLDSDGWVLDGNHRATAARLHGIKMIPVLKPYRK